MSSSANPMMGSHGMPSQFPGSGMHPGGMHPFSPSVFPGGPMMHGGAANPMVMNRLGGGPPHFRPGMLTPQQQQQYMQQQHQMMAAAAAAGQNPMLKGPMAGMMQQSPGQPPFPPNSHPLAMQQQMMQQQMMNKSAGLMPPPNASSSQSFDPQNTSIFGKQQGGMGARPGEQPYNQRQQQQQQMMNRFGSPPLTNITSGITNNHGSPASSAGSSIFNTPTGAGTSNSFMDGQGSGGMHHSSFHQQQSPFGSPTSGAMSMNKQQSLVGRSMAPCSSASSLLNNTNNQMDYQLSSVSSTSSAGGPTAISTTTGAGGGMQMSSATALYSAINLDAIINSLQNGRSFVVAVLMQDTVIDLHYDSIFDACPICCCKSNIRAYELGVYINAPEDVAKCDEIQRKQQSDPDFLPDHWSGFCVPSSSDPMQQQSKCSCGFSAVRHRYLCGAGAGNNSGLWGLFPEDLNEACGDRAQRRQQLNFASKALVARQVWFNPNNSADRQFIDMLRHQCLTRDICSVVRSAYYLGDFPDSAFENKNHRGASTNSCTTNDYSVSRVDSVELNQIMSSIVGIAVSSTGLQKELNRPSKSHQPIFHPWGVQIANSVREPKESEYIAVIRELQPLLEVTMFQARIGAQSPNKKFEGPLTWRSFLKKMAKTATQSDETEATEREPVTTNPQLVNAWEKLALAPYDQTKDVLYLAVVPDSNVVVEKCRVFLEELSNMYEKCRFGSHVKMQTKDSPRDAIIRVGHQRLNGINPGPSTNGHNGSLQAFLNAFEEGKYVEDKKGLTSKLRGFIENYERELTQFFRANEHTLFERRAYHESIQRNNQHQHYTSLATSSDSSSMPPPAVPIQSPSSILSSASGPASGNCTAHLSVGPMPGVVQLSPSGQPIPGQPQQQSPNPLSNNAPGMEELTPESQHNGGTPNPHLQQQQQQQLDQANAIIEANIEKTVEEMLSLESPSYLPHVIVIYLINPFSFGSEAHHAIFARLANVALMRAFNSFLHQLDIRRRPQIQLEMISLQSLYDYTAFASDPLREDRQSMESVENFTCRDKMSAQDCLRRTAFSVYSQSRLLMAENTRGVLPKSMTRFGPTSAMSDILDSLKSRPSTRLYKVPSSPFILAPSRIVSLTGPSNNPSCK
uniref:Mediator of RNA polymerase II transcription subunit 13 n=1 Tax=Ditylenchus dipsaci TaxID=166011 RepID=A0A915DHM3_9BILA